VQNVSHNQCTKLHDGSDLGHQLGVSHATFPNPRPTSKAASPAPTSPAQAPGLRWIGGPPRGAGRLGRRSGEAGDTRTGFAAACSSVDDDRLEPAEAPVEPLSPPVAGPAAPLAVDDRGFVNSDARCDGTQTAVAIGRTPGSLVAICGDPDGRYGYLPRPE
jgi:hypothetical protein